MSNPFEHLRKKLTVGGQEYSYFSLSDLNDPRLVYMQYNQLKDLMYGSERAWLCVRVFPEHQKLLPPTSVKLANLSMPYRAVLTPGFLSAAKLPFCIRVLLESAIRCCDGEKIQKKDVENILGWEQLHRSGETEIQWKPARVILQDFTGVPCVVDLAAMRDATKRLGGDASRINPGVPVDLVIDHSVQVDKFRSKEALEANLQLEMQRNKERFVFLKWGAKAFDGLTIVPPGSGIVHQVNLEYISRVVFNNKGVLYPDSLVGTDSHTPMVNGLGVVGWGVGGIEAEAVMLAQPISMVLPEVIGYKLTGSLPSHATATDLILAITKELRKKGVVEKFVEFFGPGVAQLSIADRATISNMSPETGATICFFPVDEKALDYMRLTGRSDDCVAWTAAYLKAQGLFRDYSDASQDAHYSSVLELDLSTIVPCIAGPKRPHDYVPLVSAKTDFLKCLENPVGHKGFAISEAERSKTAHFKFDGKEYSLKHGDVVLAAITSCTNTSNPNVLIGAGLLAKKAVAKGLAVDPYIKTSLAPGSGVVTQYLERSGLLPFLEQLGFNVVGYGCTTCIGNSGPLPDEVAQTIESNDLVAAGVLSGNRNFEGRIHPNVRANYLASPPLVVAYALAGTMVIDFESEPIGNDQNGQPVYLRDLWPSAEEIASVVQGCVLKEMFLETYQKVTQGTASWNALDAPSDKLYAWDPASTYIHNPPYFQNMTKELNPITKVDAAYCLLNLGDSITTDHISPAGSIAKNSPAARYLEARGVARDDWNSYGARRGNDEVMARGTFANIRLVNKLMGGKPGPKTVHVPSGESLDIFDASAKYLESSTPLIILAGEQYGSGSSRDWAAKGTWMLGVKAVFAQSYERIHRSNLVLFGVVPFQFKEGENADKLGLTGKETFSFDLGNPIVPGSDITVHVSGNDNIKQFTAVLRFDTETEVTYYRNGGVLNYVVREQIAKAH